jgi:RNA-directed DNA polymerase
VVAVTVSCSPGSWSTSDRRRLRAILHNAARTGLAARNPADRPAFAAHLAGRIDWVGQGSPHRAAKLRVLLAAALAGGG